MKSMQYFQNGSLKGINAWLPLQTTERSNIGEESVRKSMLSFNIWGSRLTAIGSFAWKIMLVGES